MGGKCCAPQHASDGAEVAMLELKIRVLVVKVEGLPADKVPLEDRNIYFSVSLPETGVDVDIDKRLANVIDPVFNHEFEVQAGILEFKVMEEVAGSEAVLLGQATLDARDLDSFAGDLPLKGGSVSGAIITVKVKAEGFEYPINAAIADYMVKIDNPRKSKNFGLELDNSDQMNFYVSNVKVNGLVDKHNKLQEEGSKKLQAEAYIVAYNGVGDGLSAIESQMKKAASMAEFTVRPVEKLRIAIDTSAGNTLGVNVPSKPVGTSVLIVSVREGGSVAKWNDEHPEQRVKENDRIVEVNGKKGKAKELMDMVKKAPKSTRVVLTIARIA